MKFNVANDISPPIPYLAKLWFSNYGPKCCCLIKLQDSCKGNISVQFISGIQIKIKVFCKLILSLLVCVARHAQSTQNWKFASLQYFQKSMWDEVGCLPADKHKCFLQVNSIALKCTKLPKITSLQYLKKNMKDKVDFLQINTRGFCKLILSFQVCMARHAQITQNNKFAVFLQYLQKELSDEVDSCIKINVSYKLIL